MATQNRTNTQGKDQQVIQGVNKDLSTMSSLPLGAETYTPASVTALVQSRIDAANQVAVAKAAWLNAAKAYDALNTKVTVVVHDLKQLVIGAFGSTSPKLADFGFTARKVTVLTPEQKVAAAAKRKATRAARNTLGPKAKLAIKGTVPATAPATAATPAVTPVTPGATAAPAAATNGTPTASAAAPAQAPTVTVNVTSAPAAAPVASTATAAVNPPEQVVQTVPAAVKS